MIYGPEHENGIMQIPLLVRGDVLVLGLGIGTIVQKLLRFQCVRSIRVVENDPAIIEAYYVTDDRVSVVEADAGTYYQDNKESFDFVCQDLPTPFPGGHWLKVKEYSAWASV